MANRIVFAGISGSLREGSYNTMLLENVKDLLPDNVFLDILPLGDLPLYNADLDVPTVPQRPEVVQLFRDRLSAASALVIASPEYNYSISGVLKNAIDWASRGDDSPLLQKPVALMGATQGMWGTTRMQQDFHPIYQYLNMKPVYKPEVYIAQASEKFNAQRQLTDETAKKLIREQMKNLQQLLR